MRLGRMIRWAALSTGLLLGLAIGHCGDFTQLELGVVIAGVALFLGDVANTLRPPE